MGRREEEISGSTGAFLWASGFLLRNEFNLKAAQVVLSSASGDLQFFDENPEGGVESGVHFLRLP